jgi:multidrug efflux pump subunit AcrA (membrane-fusion protein)
MLAKLIIFSVVAITLVVCNWVPMVDLRLMHRVTAPFQFVPIEKFAVAAPFEGKIEEIGRDEKGEKIRPGMVVKKGDILLRLDTRELRKQLNQATARVAELSGKVSQAAEQVDRDRTKINDWQIFKAELQGALAEADLLQYRIDRATIVSPYDGVILSGDVEDKVNAPVKEGDLLMEVGPIHDLKVKLDVAERDIQYIVEQQQRGQTPHGQLATTSSPTEKYGFKVDRIVPLGSAKEGANKFDVYAVLDGSADPLWRPGMMGEARVDVEKKPMIWIWTHRLLDFVRLKLWLPF